MIRVAEAADAHAIATIQVSAWRTAYRGLMPDALLDDLDVDAKAARWRLSIEAPDMRILVVERSGVVAGFACVSGARDLPDGAHGVGEIWAMYVSPEHWREGCGRELMHGARDYFSDTGRTRIILWVLEANASARRFYEAEGFAPDGATKTHPPSGQGEMRYSCDSVKLGVQPRATADE